VGVKPKIVFKVFLTSVIILALAVVAGFLFFPFSWGFSLPLAIYYLPLFYFIFRLISLFFIKDPANRKSTGLGILAGIFLWVGTCSSFVMIPSYFQGWFRITFPGLRKYDLDRTGTQIAKATHGSYLGADVRDGRIYLELNKWQQVNAEIRGRDLFEVNGYTADTLASFDSLLIARRFQQLSEEFLNSEGKKVMKNGTWTQKPSRQKNNETGKPQMIDVTLSDGKSNILLANVFIGRSITIRIQKNFSIVDDAE
jgi:hypothetical protein